jgi:hypothetical protein
MHVNILNLSGLTVLDFKETDKVRKRRRQVRADQILKSTEKSGCPYGVKLLFFAGSFSDNQLAKYNQIGYT